MAARRLVARAPRREELEALLASLDAMATELDQRRTELERSERTARTLVEQIPAVVYRSSTAEDRWFYVSPQIETLVGVTPAEWLAGRGLWTAALHPDDRERVLTEEEEALARGSFNSEYRLRRADGQDVWVRDEAILVSANGDTPYWQGLLIDVTAQRVLEESLRHAQKMEAIGLLAGGVAHDFNNLLTAIRGYSELALQQLPETAPARRDVEQVRAAADSAALVTAQLLALARKQPRRPVALDLNELVASLQPFLRRLIDESIELVTVLDERRCVVVADRGQMEQVVLNLAVNARDAMPGGGTLEIRVGRGDPDAAATITVTDTGVGMDEATLARIFEPFFTTKEAGKGTGLGLATVRGIVDGARGTVDARSAPGAGSTVVVSLPLVGDPSGATVDGAGADPAPVLHGTVLLVEDDPGVRTVARRILADAGLAVLDAASGDEAIAIAEAGLDDVDLLLTDVVMPGMTGPELAERLRELRPDLRVLLMSGYTSDLPLDDAQPLLAKPFQPSSLVAAVESLLDA